MVVVSSGGVVADTDFMSDTCRKISDVHVCFACRQGMLNVKYNHNLATGKKGSYDRQLSYAYAKRGQAISFLHVEGSGVLQVTSVLSFRFSADNFSAADRFCYVSTGQSSLEKLGVPAETFRSKALLFRSNSWVSGISWNLT